jgi:hypothetical protein
MADFITETGAQIERLRFDVKDILTSDTRAAILGSLASKVKRTGRICPGRGHISNQSAEPLAI